MNTSRAQIRARVLAGLDRVSSIEDRPIEEVQLAFDEMGIDPTGAIEFAKRLAAADPNDPAADLLKRLEFAEEMEAEIEALDAEPIDDVLAKLPEGLREPFRVAIDDEPDIEEEVFRPRRRLGSALGWGASVAGIAACILLYIAIRPDQLGWVEEALSPVRTTVSTISKEPAPIESDRAETEAVGPADPALDDGDDLQPTQRRAVPKIAETPRLALDSPAPSRAPAVASNALGNASTQVEALEPVQAADASDDQLAPQQRAVQSFSEEFNDQARDIEQALADRTIPPEGPSVGSGDQEGEVAQTTASATLPPIPLPRPAFVDPASEIEVTDTVALATPRADASRPTGAIAPGIPVNVDDVTAAFLIDADLSPRAVKELENPGSNGRLAARLGEASLLALGRKVVALISYENGGQEVDAAIVVPKPEASVAESLTAGASSFAPSGEAASIDDFGADFELIRLRTKD
jgi:hypothetical protein